MHQFRAAQPALLYLSPACILSVACTALFRGELQKFWSWSDEDEESKKDVDAKQELSKSAQNGNGKMIDSATSTALDSEARENSNVRHR